MVLKLSLNLESRGSYLASGSEMSNLSKMVRTMVLIFKNECNQKRREYRRSHWKVVTLQLH